MFWKKKLMHYQLDQQPSLDTPLRDLSFTVFDTETTGFAVGGKDRVIEIGAVQVAELMVTDNQFQTYVNPERDIPPKITELTGIEQHFVDQAPSSLEAIESFFQFIEKSKSGGWVGHYLSFDVMVIRKELQRAKYTFEQPLYIDTLDMIGYLCPSWDMRDLEQYARSFGTNMYDRHSAIGDALTTAHLFVELLRLLEDRGKTTLADLVQVTDANNRNRVLQF
ncbi:PolC-type DNA polymerase III [Alkalihalobacterium alkalinitrilicum]|uniref:3'-5' exonuclease n=1 Tax=Alkalihalobacterium alkalinitrilicum TaxID=427920 RepID=UPI000995D7F7|nr:3'-5' exonuclease [Alkalihalobacterium alkalinitrilicum]